MRFRAITEYSVLDAPPEGFYAPDDRFAPMWSGYEFQPEVLYQDLLGWGTTPAQSYTMNRQGTRSYGSSRSEHDLFISVPDGTTIEMHDFMGRYITWRFVQ